MLEEKWFKQYTWNGEANVTRVIIEMSRGTQTERDAIARVVEPYFTQLGLKEESNVTHTLSKKQIFEGWLVDFTEKKFKRMTAWEMSRLQRDAKESGEIVPSAWPSHLKIHMTEKKGLITGRKFGL